MEVDSDLDLSYKCTNPKEARRCHYDNDAGFVAIALVEIYPRAYLSRDSEMVVVAKQLFEEKNVGMKYFQRQPLTLKIEYSVD